MTWIVEFCHSLSRQPGLHPRLGSAQSAPWWGSRLCYAWSAASCARCFPSPAPPSGWRGYWCPDMPRCTTGQNNQHTWPLKLCHLLSLVNNVVCIEVNASVDLGCEYELGGEQVYSLKWYRDHTEIFRWQLWRYQYVLLELETNLHEVWSFAITEMGAPTRAFSCLKVPTCSFTFETILMPKNIITYTYTSYTNTYTYTCI